MIYADSSALVKLVAPELESDSMRAFADSPGQLFTSVIGATELRRAVRRTHPTRAGAAEELLNLISTIGLSKEIVRLASVLGPPSMRTLDAIHLATALTVSEQLDAFVAYDKQLIEAAETAGLTVISPQ
jgi:predicted nucleic acid-binding protein